MSTQVGMYIDRDHLIVPIQTELRDNVIERLQMDILENVREARLRGVIIDFSGVSLLDTFQAQRLFDIGKMANLLGATSVFTGLSAGIVVSLIELGFEPGEVLTATGIEEGTELLNTFKHRPQLEAYGEAGPDDENDVDKEPNLHTNDEKE